MRYLRSHLFDLLLLLWTSLFAPGIPILWLCGLPETIIRSMTRLWASGALFMLRCVVGLDYVQFGTRSSIRGPCLIVSNHQSMWETLAFLVIFPDVTIIAKRELLRVPVFGWYLRHSPMIIIDRASGQTALRKMINQSEKMALGGRSILVFPEGSRVPVKEPVRFQRGIELLYVQLGLPVLPVAVNSGLFWSPFDRYRLPGTITVSHLRPIEPGMKPWEFIRKIEREIGAEVERLNQP